MSDITYSRRADALLEAGPDQVSRAGVNATLAVAKVGREIDSKLKYVGEMISGTIAACASGRDGQSEEWITWEDMDGTHKAVQVRYVQSFASDGDEAVLFVDGVPQPVRVPISYGTIALMVGA